MRRSHWSDASDRCSAALVQMGPSEVPAETGIALINPIGGVVVT
jgi:hypothetical protein